MESSGEQALIIGVNLFILIAALTCAIMLMTTVLNMSEAANTTIKTTTDSSLMTLYGGTNERIYTGEQILTIIEEYLSPTTNVNNKYVLKVNEKEINESYVVNKNFTKAMLDSTYKLMYYGKEASGRYIYSFEKVQ